MNGGETSARRRAGGLGDDAVERLGARAAEALDVGVAVAPQHALGHARGAAGVQDVEVVRAPRRRPGGRATTPASASSYHTAPGSSSLPESSATCRITRSVGQGRRAPRRASGAKRLCTTMAVARASRQQVAQLVGDVAVVDVERGDPRLERAEHRLEVLVAVVQVDAEVVLPALVVGQVGTLDVAPEALAEEVVGQPPGALGDLSPRSAGGRGRRGTPRPDGWRRSPRGPPRRSVPSSGVDYS